MKKQKNNRKKLIIILTILAVLIALPFVVSGIMVAVEKEYILLAIEPENSVAVAVGETPGTTSLPKDSVESLAEIEADCILVLGAGLKQDGTPNHMLQDRLDMGIALYNQGVAPKLLLSGDNGQEEYDEVNAMKAYVLQAQVPEEDIFMDHAGFSTYESMYRAKEIFGVERVIIVTQKYHQYRALYIARGLGLEGYGAASDPRTYGGQSIREAREILARDKDFIKTMIKPQPTYLGEAIPISGNGLVTQD